MILVKDSTSHDSRQPPVSFHDASSKSNNIYTQATQQLHYAAEGFRVAFCTLLILSPSETAIPWLLALILMCPTTAESARSSGVSMDRFARASSPKMDLAYRLAAM